MINADSDRLLKALLISIMFHAFMFAGMNLLDWFPEMDIPPRLAPVTLRIEKVSQASDTPMADKEIVPVPAEIPKQSKPVPIKTQDTPEPPSPESSAYDDMFTKKDMETSVPLPLLVEEKGEVKDFRPEESKIEYEEYGVETGSSDVIETGSHGLDIDTEPPQVISAEDLNKVTEAIAESGTKGSSNSVGGQETDNKLPEYSDQMFKFDDGSVKRELLVNPPPEMPDDLPSDFPPEITYKIRFSLNPDGLVRVLSIEPSSVYPRIDASIRKALRSWSFSRSTGSEVVEGTITLIFKAK